MPGVVPRRVRKKSVNLPPTYEAANGANGANGAPGGARRRYSTEYRVAEQEEAKEEAQQDQFQSKNSHLLKSLKVP